MTLFFVIITGLLFSLIMINQQIYNKKLQRVKIVRKNLKNDYMFRIKK